MFVLPILTAGPLPPAGNRMRQHRIESPVPSSFVIARVQILSRDRSRVGGAERLFDKLADSFRARRAGVRQAGDPSVEGVEPSSFKPDVHSLAVDARAPGFLFSAKNA